VAKGKAGLTSRRPGRKPKLGATNRALLAATKQNEILQRKLRVANALIDRVRDPDNPGGRCHGDSAWPRAWLWRGRLWLGAAPVTA
jgi:hypothetical protein